MALSPLFPQLWSARITYFATQFSAFLPNATRQWEGEAIYGNTIKIPTVDRSVTLNVYNRTTNLVGPDDIDATTQDLSIDQEKYFTFALEDLDARQSRISGASLIDLKSQGAGLAISSDLDAYVSGLLSAIAGNNLLLNRSAATFNLNFASTVKLMATLNGLPHSGLVMVTAPEVVQDIEDGIVARTYGDALSSTTFGSSTASDPSLSSGRAMTIAGIPLFVSRDVNLRARSSGSAPITNADRGNRSVMYVYNPLDLALVMQVNQTETYRLEQRFSTGVKGLVNYGAKVLNAGRIMKFVFND